MPGARVPEGWEDDAGRPAAIHALPQIALALAQPRGNPTGPLITVDPVGGEELRQDLLESLSSNAAAKAPGPNSSGSAAAPQRTVSGCSPRGSGSPGI